MRIILSEMKNFLRFLNNLFYLPPSKAERERRREKTVNRLIRRFSRNWRLQQGRYMTQKDVDRLRESALRCRF